MRTKATLLHMLPMIALAMVPAIALVVANDVRVRRAVGAVQREHAAVDADLARARAEKSTLLDRIHAMQERQRHVTVMLGTPDVRGGLDAAVVERVVRARLPDVSACYDAVLTHNPWMRGDVTMSWIVNGDGSMYEVTIGEMSVSAASVTNCLAQRISHWRFPAAQGKRKTIVAYPFRFEPATRD